MKNQIKAIKIMLSVLFFILIFSGCKKDEGEVTSNTQSDLKTISAFSFTKANNSALTGDLTGTVGDDVITLDAPVGTDVTALIASFTTDGTKIEVSTLAQLSDTTSNDFRNPVVYTITAANGTSQKYTVTVTVATLSTAKSMSAFSLTSAKNAALSKDLVGTISGTTITTGTLFYGTDISALIATFTHDGLKVTVGVNEQTSGTTANDFSSPVTYQVNAADSSTQNYSIDLVVIPKMADTGQILCYDATAILACPSSGSAFYGQDSQYNTVNQQSYTDNGDGTVKDNNTGVMWAQCSSGLSGTNCATGTAIQSNWTDAKAYCTGLTHATYSDWRLPTVTEILRITDIGAAAPRINGTFFPGTIGSDYWSGTTYGIDTAQAWRLNFGSTEVWPSNKTTATTIYSRCAR